MMNAAATLCMGIEALHLAQKDPSLPPFEPAQQIGKNGRAVEKTSATEGRALPTLEERNRRPDQSIKTGKRRFDPGYKAQTICSCRIPTTGEDSPSQGTTQPHDRRRRQSASSKRRRQGSPGVRMFEAAHKIDLVAAAAAYAVETSHRGP